MKTVPRARAFSLLEMLVVLAIIAILAALAIPEFSNLSQAYQLDAAASTVVGQLSLARQNAVTGNRVVQVRFYLLPEASQPEQSTPSVYRAVQCFLESDPPASGPPALRAITRPYYFPAPVVISTNGAVSSILPATPLAPGTVDPKLGSYGNNYRYAGFRFKPDGSTGLTNGGNTLTLVIRTAPSSDGSLPSNYQTLVIDPMLGTVRIFRP